MAKHDLSPFIVRPENTLRDVIECFNKNMRGAALVLDAEGRLLDVLTDGDLRRASLAGLGLETRVETLRERRRQSAYPEPISAPAGTSPAALLDLMQKNSIRFVPVLDDKKHLVDLVMLSDLLPEESLPLQAVIMAGGFGKRLMPLTANTPKPMLKVGEKPLLELTLQKLRASGIKQVSVTTHYKGDVITKHFGNGHKFGVNLNYIEEDRPLGTVGALRGLAQSREPILVMNGDILTDVDFRALLDFHRESQADITIGVRSYELRIPFGVVEMSGERVTGIAEKPVLTHFINSGIYLLNPALCRFIPGDRPFDMPDLIKAAIAAGHRAVSFPIHEYWLDVGTRGDYEIAKKAFRKGKKKRR